MTGQCPECGALLAEDLTCQSIFDQFLVLEYSDPEYGTVHFLTVACFMIQHGRYSDEGLVWIEQKLRDAIERGVPIEQIRRQAAKETRQGKRTWKVTRQPGDQPQARLTWTLTIVDVAHNYTNADNYRRWVREWARTTLDEMQPLLSKSK